MLTTTRTSWGELPLIKGAWNFDSDCQYSIGAYTEVETSLTSSRILLIASFGASVLFFGWVSRSVEKQHFFSTAMSTSRQLSYLLRVQRTRTKQPQEADRIRVTHSLSLVPRPHPRRWGLGTRLTYICYSPISQPWLRDKIWEWPGDGATFVTLC